MEQRDDREVPALHVERVGEGPITVVLAHGFGGSARNFRATARALAARATFVLYDQRGHARSPAPADPAAYTAAALVGDFEAVVEREAPAGTRVVAGGLSMGAGVALAYALQRPERVRGLVLAAFPPGGNEARDAGSSRSQARWAEDFADAIEQGGLEAAGAVFAWGPSSGFDPAAARLVRQGFLEHPAHGVQALLRGVLARQPSAAELASQLRRLEVPVLVVVGGDDALSRGPSRVLARALPRARLVEVPAAGHVVNLAAPERFHAELGAFLDALPREAEAAGSRA